MWTTTWIAHSNDWDMDFATESDASNAIVWAYPKVFYQGEHLRSNNEHLFAEAMLSNLMMEE